MADTEEKVNGNQGDTEVKKAQGAESAAVSPQKVKSEADMVVDSDNKGGDAGNQRDVADLDDKIIRQMEYYFGDINLARDKFLQEQFKLDDGWVPMTTMLKFKRLQALSEDPVVICNALRKSPRGLIEVSEENDKVRRSPSKPLPENTAERVAEVKARSIYAKGFPLDSSMDQLEEFFRGFGEIENIFMRKQIKKKFKGSVFVIFAKAEDAEKFVKTDDLKYGETVLIKSMKDDYFKRKNEERQQQKLEKEKERKATREENEKQKTEKEAQELQERITKGSILHLTGLSGDTSIEDIKNFFNDYSRVQWVDLENDDKEAFVRFSEADKAAEVLAKVKEGNDGKIEVGGSQLEGTVLEGEAELERWKKIFEAQAESWKRKKSGRFNQHQGKKRGFGNKKHGQYRGNKGSRDKSEGEPPAKVAKTE